jgi:hypothetical protein
MHVTYGPIWFNEIGLLVLSYLCNSIKATTNMLPYTPNKRFSKEFKRKKNCIRLTRKLSFLVNYHFGCWSLLTPFNPFLSQKLQELGQSRLKNNIQAGNFIRNLKKKIRLEIKIKIIWCWLYFDPLTSWQR